MSHVRRAVRERQCSGGPLPGLVAQCFVRDDQGCSQVFGSTTSRDGVEMGEADPGLT